MRTFEIPRQHWTDLAKLIDRHAAGRPIRVEILRMDLGDQEAGDLLPFLGLDYDPKGGSVGENLTITAGFEARDEITHRIFEPARVYIAVNDLGTTEWMAIEDHAGDKTLIHFEELPELEAEQITESP